MKKRKHTKRELKLIAVKIILENIDKISHNVYMELKKKITETK